MGYQYTARFAKFEASSESQYGSEVTIETHGSVQPPVLPSERDRFAFAQIDRCKHWLDVGAVPSETVSSLLKKSGLEHKQLRLPKPGKPKVVPAAPGEATAAKTETAPATA